MKNMEEEKPLISYIASIVVLVIDCIVFSTTQNITYRNVLLGMAYVFMGLSAFYMIKRT